MCFHKGEVTSDLLIYNAEKTLTTPGLQLEYQIYSLMYQNLLFISFSLVKRHSVIHQSICTINVNPIKQLLNIKTLHFVTFSTEFYIIAKSAEAYQTLRSVFKVNCIEAIEDSQV